MKHAIIELQKERNQRIQERFNYKLNSFIVYVVVPAGIAIGFIKWLGGN